MMWDNSNVHKMASLNHGLLRLVLEKYSELNSTEMNCFIEEICLKMKFSIGEFDI